MTLQLIHHFTTIFSIVVEENSVSCIIMIEVFCSYIKVFKHILLLGMLRPLTFQEMYFIGKVGGGRIIFQPYSLFFHNLGFLPILVKVACWGPSFSFISGSLNNIFA
jgi:hypothetical protein